jgi:hypothetical protein
MGKRPVDDPATYPPLGRWLTWVDRPGNPTKIVRGLAVVCLLLFLSSFVIQTHGHLEAENIPGFYAVYGFVMFTALILAAKALRTIIRRPEDFYGDKAIDAEAYPPDQLDTEKNND